MARPDPAKKTGILIPLGKLPPEPVLYMVRKVLFHAADAARKGEHKDMAKAFEEAGRGTTPV